MTYKPGESLGNYLPTNIVLGEDPHTLREQLTEYLQLNSDITNNKEIGTVSLVEQLSGKLLFIANNPQKYRSIFRIGVNFGPLPNTTSTSVPHNIPNVNSDFTFTYIGGCATDPSALQFIPIPYAGTNSIEISVDSTNVTITTTSNRTAFTRCIITLEYTKEV